MGNANMKFHPHTGALIEPLWVRPDGRAMWPILGASPDDPPPTDPPPSDPPPADPPKTDPPKPDDDGKGGKQAVLDDLAKEREKRKGLETQLSEFQTTQQQQMDAIAKALGLKEDAAPDPAVLTQQIQSAQSETLAAKRELAVYKNAGANAANADELLDSASFLRSIDDVDPTDATAMGKAIKDAVAANPKFQANPTPATPPFNGGPRPPTSTRAGSLGEAISNKIAAQRS